MLVDRYLVETVEQRDVDLEVEVALVLDRAPDERARETRERAEPACALMSAP